MESGALETSFVLGKQGGDLAVDKEENGLATAPPNSAGDSNRESVVKSPNDKDRILDSAVEDGNSCDASKQLVLYEPKANGTNGNESSGNQSGSGSKELVLYEPNNNVLSPDPLHCQPPHLRGSAGSNLQPRVLPAVGAFTVQCADCFKWRLIPTKEKYEEIREHIMDRPFVCDTAREWRPEISCDDPPDIQQDGSRLWAIDKPSIAQPPPGWERELRIRGEGSSKFADVYYISPDRKRFRSMVEIQKYLLLHPEYVQQGVKLSQFSFQIPKPLQENYVRKRNRVVTPCNNPNLTPLGSLEHNEVSPLSLAPPADSTVLRLGGPGPGPPNAYYSDTHASLEASPAKRQKTATERSPSSSNGRLNNKIKIKIGYPRPRTPTPDDAT